MRDLLAGNRTLLAWIRTAISFAGLGFVVAKFGITVEMTHFAQFLGALLAAIGLLFTVMGAAQFWTTLRQEGAPEGAPVPTRWPAVTAAACCALSCALIVVYLATS
jgi:putative membrane protein